MKPNKGKAFLIPLAVIMFCGLVSAADNFVLQMISIIPIMVARFIVYAILIPFIGWCISSLKALILLNPNPDVIAPMVADVIRMLAPVYVMTISLLGVYIIFLSNSPQGRSKAKSVFWRLIMSMALVSVSLEFFKILLSISELLSRRILAGIITTEFPELLVVGEMDIFTVLAISALLFIVLLVACVVALWRYLTVLIVLAVFPITIFLYFFEFTKDMGSALLRYTLLAIYTQVVQALMLAITVLALNSVVFGEGGFIEGLVPWLLVCAGAVMVALSPLIMLGLLKWIGGVVSGAGILVSMVNPAAGSAMVAMGGVASGMGPGALMAGGLTYFYGSSYKRSIGSIKKPPSKTEGAAGGSKGWLELEEKERDRITDTEMQKRGLFRPGPPEPDQSGFDEGVRPGLARYGHRLDSIQDEAELQAKYEYAVAKYGQPQKPKEQGEWDTMRNGQIKDGQKAVTGNRGNMERRQEALVKDIEDKLPDSRYVENGELADGMKRIDAENIVNRSTSDMAKETGWGDRELQADTLDKELERSGVSEEDRAELVKKWTGRDIQKGGAPEPQDVAPEGGGDRPRAGPGPDEAPVPPGEQEPIGGEGPGGANGGDGGDEGAPDDNEGDDEPPSGGASAPVGPGYIEWLRQHGVERKKTK